MIHCGDTYHPRGKLKYARRINALCRNDGIHAERSFGQRSRFVKYDGVHLCEQFEIVAAFN